MPPALPTDQLLPTPYLGNKDQVLAPHRCLWGSRCEARASIAPTHGYPLKLGSTCCLTQNILNFVNQKLSRLGLSVESLDSQVRVQRWGASHCP